MTPQPTPQAIKEAAEKEYPMPKPKWFPETSDNYERMVIAAQQIGFETGATHPETEKHYTNEFQAVITWAMINGYDIGTNGREILFTNINRIITYFPAMLQLYRESNNTTTPSNTH